MLNRGQQGFTIIEIAITLVILSLLTYLATPSFIGWMGNAKARSMGESVQNGLRQAQAEAVRRNRQVAFVLTNAAPAANTAAAANGKNWYIQVLPIVAAEVVANPLVSQGAFSNVASGLTVTGPALVCFNSLGRVVTNSTASVTGAFGAGCTVTTANYDITAPGANRTYEVQLSMGGQIRMCDKTRTLSATAPDGC